MGSNRIVVLTDGLADLVPFKEDAYRVVTACGVPARMIPWEGSPLTRWDAIVRAAEEHEKLVEVVELAVKDAPKHRYLVEVARGSLTLVRGPDIEEWRGQVDEIIVGVSNLLPIHYLARGMRRAASVARVIRGDGGLGTGFLIAGKGGPLLVTNHHVLQNADVAAAAQAQFDYEKNADELDIESTRLGLSPQLGFAASEADDWAASRIDDVDRWGVVPLPGGTAAVGARVTIIQHPAGEPKHIALHDNEVVYTSGKRLQYLTDTLPGSSGSPVFDLQWRLVGVHHSGGLMREPGAAKALYRNEGIAAATVVDGLRLAGLLPDP